MRHLPLDSFASFSRRFDLFDPGLEYDQSLLAAGLFPPLPVCGEELIWGFRILDGAEKSGLEALPAVEISGKGRLLCALKLENRSGEYSWKERLAIYSLAMELGDDENRDAVSLAVSGNRGFFSLMSRYKKLPDYLTAGVNDGKLDLGIAEKVATLPKAACELVFSSTSLSFSRLRALLINLAEIQQRDALSDDRLIALTAELLDSGDPAAAAGRIRNPQLSLLTRRFEAIKAKYTRHTGVNLQAPLYFEGDAYTVSFSFSTGTELQRKMRTLEKLEDGCSELEDLL